VYLRDERLGPELLKEVVINSGLKRGHAHANDCSHVCTCMLGWMFTCMRICMIHMHEHSGYACVLVNYPILRRREGSLVLVYCGGACFWNVSSIAFPHAFREEETQGSVKRKGREREGEKKGQK
jgi:hypothetical protein